MSSNSSGISPSISVLFMVAVTLRWIVSFYGYSGEGKPPMYGDYEAQRHWMEVTFHLPIKEWYVNSSRNDLQYWGLDYPPLTAYHSLLCGYFANLLDPSYIEYNVSRGYECSQHKLFMRSTVLISDMLTFLPAACLFSKFVGSQQLVVVLLIYPGLILIDHGHFQYNCVSLGLALFAFLAFVKNKVIMGSFFFCLAINFKQMILYYALPVFFYLLGKCIFRGWMKGTITFLILGSTVITTFILLWWPFVDVAELVVKRIFPIERGIFEDKVANIWCFVNIFIKVRNFLKNNQLAMLSGIITFISVLPSSLHTFIYPFPRNLLLALINSSFGFFLFSYQVHEKTILIVSLPVMLLFMEEPLHCLWFLLISSLSLLPLLIADKLFIPFIALNVMYIIILWNYIPKESIKKLAAIFLIISISLSLLLIILSIAVPPPAKYPHLFPLLVSAFCACHFCYFFLYFNWVQLVKIKDR